MKTEQPSFKDCFEQKMPGDADAGLYTDMSQDEIFDLMDLLESDGSFLSMDDCPEEGIMGNIIAVLMADGVNEKDLIAAVLDNCVEHVESMIDTVDVFHLIAAHRDMPRLSNTVPFELAQQVGYSFEEYEAMCNDLDSRLNALIESAINESIGTLASENNCF